VAKKEAKMVRGIREEGGAGFPSTVVTQLNGKEVIGQRGGEL
jgi:hypothetical protein